jgi:succinate-semialdehyde dehydrogenase / glutarate-semialdehyde dehydrogenase
MTSAFMAAASGRTFSSLNPATGAAAGEVPDCSAEDMRAAAAAAAAAFPDWRRRPAAARGRLIRALGQLIGERAQELAALITEEQGKPLGEARFEVMLAAEALLWFAEEGRRSYGQTIPDPMANRRLVTLKQPVGVVAAITPWNIPLLALPRKVGAALAAGCTVVLKPAEQTPLVARAFAALADEAGLPAGVLTVVTTSQPAPAVDALLEDPRVRKLSFTGSTEVGRALMARAAATVRNVTMELGGNAPAIIFPDADLATAVADLVALKTQMAGQNCLAPNRVYVHASVLDEFTAALLDRVGGIRVGDGATPGVTMGPLIDRQALHKVECHVQDAVARGARLLTGGSRLAGAEFSAGCFFPPTVLADTPAGALALAEETFGPVYPIASFTSEAAVVAEANAGEQGLAAYVFTRDLGRAMRVSEALETGMVAVNENRVASTEAPFGGVKASGIGRESGHDGLEAYLETKTIALRFEEDPEQTRAS